MMQTLKPEHLATIYMASVSAACFVALLVAFLRMGRPPRCPRCGKREWIPSPHRGRYVVYCRSCLLEKDLSI